MKIICQDELYLFFNTILHHRIRTPRSSERPKRKSKLVQKLEEEGKWGPSSTVKRRKLTAAMRDSDKAEKDKDDDQKRRECGRAVYDLWGAPGMFSSLDSVRFDVSQEYEFTLNVTYVPNSK